MRAATEPVFHYTDGNGLIGIAEDGVLRASEAAGLNDRAEIRQGWAKIRAWLDAQPDSEIIDLLKNHHGLTSQPPALDSALSRC